MDKINGKPRSPLPPKSRMGKWRVFALRAASSLIWGDGGLLFNFFCARLQVTVSWLTELVCWPGDTSGAPNDNFWKISVRKTI